MARNILAHGHALSVFDLRAEALAAARAAGAETAQSAAAVAERAEIVLASLPDPAAVELAMTGPQGVLDCIARDAVVIDTSTSSAALSQRLAAMFGARGAAYLDAPVSGAVEGAKAGTLTIMVGGDRAAFQRALAILRCIGKEIHHIGPSGSGNGLKLIIQMIYMTHVATFMEGLALGQRLSIPVATLLEVIGTSSAARPDVTKRFDKISRDDLSPRSEISLGLKDLALACALARDNGLDARISGAALESFRRATAQGFAEKDLIALRHAYLADADGR